MGNCDFISIALTWEAYFVEPSIFYTKRTELNQSSSFEILVVQTNDANEHRA